MAVYFCGAFLLYPVASSSLAVLILASQNDKAAKISTRGIQPISLSVDPTGAKRKDRIVLTREEEARLLHNVLGELWGQAMVPVDVSVVLAQRDKLYSERENLLAKCSTHVNTASEAVVLKLLDHIINILLLKPCWEPLR